MTAPGATLSWLTGPVVTVPPDPYVQDLTDLDVSDEAGGDQ